MTRALLSLPTVLSTASSLALTCMILSAAAQPSLAQPMGSSLPLTFSISAEAPNRIAVAGEKIISSVYDQQRLDVELNDETGSLFVLPLTEKPTSLFVMTQAEQTYALTLVPDAEVSSNIELTSRRPKLTEREMVAKNTWQTADHDATVRQLMHALVKDQLPEGFQAKTLAADQADSRVKNLTPLRILSSLQYQAKVDRWTNTSDTDVLIHEKMFIEPSIVAVALDSRHVGAHQSTRIYRLYRAGTFPELLSETRHDQ